MNDYSVYEVDVSAAFEITRRDVDGWVDGQAPGNGRYAEPVTATHRIVSRRECLARARALDMYSGSGIRDVAVVAIRSHRLDAILFEPV